MVKILIASDSPFLNTGLANVARFIGTTLHNAGYGVTHLGFSDPRIDKSSQKWGGRYIPWQVLATADMPEDRFGQRSYSSILSQVEPNLVIVVADVWNSDHLLVGTNCPTILFLHIEAEPLPTRLIQDHANVIPRIISHANVVISAGTFGRKTIQQRMLEYCKLPPEKTEKEIKAVISNTNIIIPDAIDTEVFKPINNIGLKEKMFKGLKETDFVIGYFGRQNPRKGLPYAIEAFTQWKDRPSNVYLYLHTAIKDRSGWNLPQLLIDSGVQDKIIIDPSIKVGGGCSDEVLNALYNTCFPAGTPVLTEIGYKCIENIKKNDMVISAQGNTRKVVETMSRTYNGHVVGITTSRNRATLTCTADHKFLVLSGRKTEYRKASDLEVGDMILTPVPTGQSYITSSSTQDICEALNIQNDYVRKRYEAVIELDSKCYKIRKRSGPIPYFSKDGKNYIISIVETLAYGNGRIRVYNIEVEEDHSYVAGGLGVKNCDITILPTTGEGFGMTVAESLAAGTPVITTDYAETPTHFGDVCELVKPDAYWVEPITNIRRAIPSIQGLVQKIKKLHRDPNYRKALSIRGREHMVSKYDTKIVAPLWLDMVEKAARIPTTIKELEQRRSKREKKRVCFIGSYFLPDLIGGGEITYYKLLKEFQERGWEAATYISRDGINDEEVTIDGIEVTRRDKMAPDRKLRAYMEATVPDVVITTLIDPNFTRMALEIARNIGATTIYYEQFYNSICTKYRDVMNLGAQSIAPWGGKILSMCDLIYSNGNFVQRAMLKHQQFNSKILHPYIDLSEARVEKREPEYVTMINPDPGKGGGTLVYLAKNMPDVKFLTIRVSANNDYSNLPKEGELPNLTIWDFQKDIRKIYEKTKLLIVPTIVDETFCRVIPEAQSNGIPIIGRDVGGIKDTMGAGGILIGKYEDDDTWKDTVSRILENKEEYENLSKLAIENSKKIDYKKEFDSFFDDVQATMKTGIKKKICCIVPDFAGVAEVFRNIKNLHSKDVEIIEINAFTISTNVIRKLERFTPEIIVFGAWVPLHKDVMIWARKNIPGVKIVASWFSNFSQMEFSVNNELGIFNELQGWMSGQQHLIDEIWMSSVEDAYVLNKPNIKPLPCPISIPEEIPSYVPEPGKIKVSLFCTPGPRKNLANQILACSKIPGVELHLNGLSKKPEFAQLLKTLNIKYVDHGWMDKSTYRNTIAAMDVGLQVTFAETFNYVVAEHMIYGVPIVVSSMIPIINKIDELKELVVENAQSPGDIAKAIETIYRSRNRLSSTVRKIVHDIAGRNNEDVRKLLSLGDK